MRRRLYLKGRAVLHDEIEGSIHLARGRETAEQITDKILGEHPDVGVLIGQIPKRPAVEAEDVQQFAKCRDMGHVFLTQRCFGVGSRASAPANRQ